MHVLVALGAAVLAPVPPIGAMNDGEPPVMLTALSPVPATSSRRSCGDPRALICEFGSTVRMPATSTTLGAAAISTLRSAVVTLQKTYVPPFSVKVPPFIVRLPYVPAGRDDCSSAATTTSAEESPHPGNSGNSSGKRQIEDDSRTGSRVIGNCDLLSSLCGTPVPHPF